MAPQKPDECDSWAPVLAQPPHGSEVAALGGALLRVRGAEAFRPIFMAGLRGLAHELGDDVCTQMAALQASNPGKVVSVSPAVVSECFECLEDLAACDLEVPASLEEPQRRCLEVVASPEGCLPPGRASGETPPGNWPWDARRGAN